MRAISLVNKIEFNFMGNVARNALTLGDVDNDGANELVVGNNKGELSVFKGKEKVQTITDLSFISCVVIGDIMNKGRNCLVIVTADGWCFIYEVAKTEDNLEDSFNVGDGSVTGESLENSSDSIGSKRGSKNKLQLICIHTQRIPANAKAMILGDIDGDGAIEMILGLTDRVVRSYRWQNNVSGDPTESSYLGKLVALNKWECANQIGSITLHHNSSGQPSLLVAQPGGTFMRIRCQLLDEASSISSQMENLDINTNNSSPESQIDYQYLGLSRMRNQNISTEILGDFKTTSDTKKPYAVATLDGTIMLVQDEVILWAIAVDHQIFALTKMDVTGNGSDDIVVCSWDGQTYILDQDKNSVRFHLEQSVQAFHSGMYNLAANEEAVTCLVYVTFNNSIIIYYDIPLKELVIKKFEPDLEELSTLFINDERTAEEALEMVKAMDTKTRNELVDFLLYNVRTN